MGIIKEKDKDGKLKPVNKDYNLISSTVDSSVEQGKVNANGGTYICYLFAGGPSPAATANCVGFNNSQYFAIDTHYVGLFKKFFELLCKRFKS